MEGPSTAKSTVEPSITVTDSVSSCCEICLSTSSLVQGLPKCNQKSAKYPPCVTTRIKKPGGKSTYFQIPTHHPIQHPMRLHMIQSHPFLIQAPFQEPKLINSNGSNFIRTRFHLSPAETLKVKQAIIIADEEITGFAVAHGG
ncbi:MAG: hypothetical protein LQ337_004656 [Flavoplaca oasis]|nr:MAG: hypothetical protein LQ337_004656 [Flavoplaca oasis]